MLVQAAANVVKFEGQDDVKAEMLRMLPTMCAGHPAVDLGLNNDHARWRHVSFLNIETTAVKDVHVVGDSIQIAQRMPRCGHMANSHATVGPRPGCQSSAPEPSTLTRC